MPFLPSYPILIFSSLGGLGVLAFNISAGLEKTH